MDWITLSAWAGVLVAQNAAFTLVSRARNSKSLLYHALASVPSNGVWFLSQFILFNEMIRIVKAAAWGQAVFIGLWYTTFTMIGSLGMHWIALHKLEKGRNV